LGRRLPLSLVVSGLGSKGGVLIQFLILNKGGLGLGIRAFLIEAKAVGGKNLG